MARNNVVIIDTGIYKDTECNKNITESYVLQKNNTSYSIAECESNDYVGHGTAIANIIYKINPFVNLISFRICNDEIDIDEDGLIYILEYIDKNIDAKIINISLGCTYVYHYKKMKSICEKLTSKGVLIVSAFDNDGTISYPAAFSNVIGIDTSSEIKDKNDIVAVNNSIVNLLLPVKYYRTYWKERMSILTGTSFATATITGLLTTKLNQLSDNMEKEEAIKIIATRDKNCEKIEEFKKPEYKISKAIIFPVNKESKALLQFRDLLNFEVVDVYDERLNGNIGINMNGFIIKSYKDIDWSSDFDTIILSCVNDLSEITNYPYSKEIMKNAIANGKKVYTFENIQCDYKGLFYPEINSKMAPKSHLCENTGTCSGM